MSVVVAATPESGSRVGFRVLLHAELPTTAKKVRVLKTKSFSSIFKRKVTVTKSLRRPRRRNRLDTDEFYQIYQGKKKNGRRHAGFDGKIKKRTSYDAKNTYTIQTGQNLRAEGNACGQNRRV